MRTGYQSMEQVRIAAIDGFTNLVRELDGDLALIMSDVGLPTQFFEDHDQNDLLGYETVEKLLQSAARLTNCPYFGALLGSKQTIRLLGIIGYVMQQSSTVRIAIEQLISHFSLHVQGGAILDLEVVGKYAFFTYKVTSNFKMVNQSTEMAVSAAFIVLKAVCGYHWNPTGVRFSHKAPANLKPYLGIFRVPVSFNQEESQFFFPKEILNKKIDQADPELSKILRNHIEFLKNELPNNLCGQVEILIRQALPSGKCSISYIASLMAVHRRTLHRMLKAEGSSFTVILEDVRKSIAINSLRHSDMTITQLANCLGYTDNSAFTRSFKRWTGKTPQRWKKENSSDGTI